MNKVLLTTLMVLGLSAGYAQQTGQLKLLWQQTIDGMDRRYPSNDYDPGLISVGGNTVFITKGGQLQALNPNNGKVIWQKGRDLGFWLAYGDNKVFALGQEKDRAVLKAFSADTGKLLWSKKHGVQLNYPTPFVMGRYVFVQNQVLDARTGKTLHVLKDLRYASRPIAILGTTVVYEEYYGEPMRPWYGGFNIQTGKFVWRSGGYVVKIKKDKLYMGPPSSGPDLDGSSSKLFSVDIVSGKQTFLGEFDVLPVVQPPLAGVGVGPYIDEG